MTDHSSIPLGHTIPAHRAFGWCSHCPDHTVAEELAAWQTREPGDVSPVQAAEVDRLRTENERMRHELEVMYSGAFDSLPSAVSAVVEPPADQTALRDRTAEAALAAVETALGDTLTPDAREEALAGIAAVLPEPADRATVLAEAADVAERVAIRRHEQHEIEREQGALDVMTVLRRMADETATGPAQSANAEETTDDAARRFARRLLAVELLCSGRPGYHTLTVKQVLTAISEADDEPAAGARQDGATP